MLPYQKFPSIYKQYPQQYQQDQVPQTPFDMAYGSSLLPRQLLIGSPYIQVQSPLPSPVHHGSFQIQRTPQGVHPSQQAAQSYFVPAPAPKLSFPPESARKRGLNYHLTLQRHNSSNSTTASYKKNNSSANELDETPSKGKFKSTASSSSSSLNDSTFDNQPMMESQNIYSNHGAISSNSSLYNLHQANSSPSLSNPMATRVSNFQVSRQPTRSILLLNVNQDLSLTEFLDTITFGPIENVRIVENYPDEDHNSIALAFLKIETCLNFYNNILTYLSKFKKANKSPDLSINFINTKKLLPFISNAINSDGATRNVYVGNLKSLDKEIDEDFLYQEFSKFGIIDKIDLITKKTDEKTDQEAEEVEDEQNDQFAFIHFTNISSAIKAVEQLSLSSNWQDVKVFYGTDRCSINSTSSLIRSITDEQDEEISQISEEDEDDLLQEELEQQLHQQQQQHRYGSQQFMTDEDISNALNQKNLTAQAVATNAGGANNVGNRTVYLGNLDPKTKPEDICNVVRGGVLQYIKHFSTKKICFLTFIEPVAAAQFYANANIDGVTLHGRKLKIGWGNHSGPLPNPIALAVTIGASRNVYIGIKDQDLSDESLKLPSEEILREDFSKFGEIEQINFFKNDRCVFLNFLNISNAIKVVDDANGNNTEKFHDYFNGKYRNFKISFGKDRCGNPPKAKKNKKRNRIRKNQQQDDDIKESNEDDQVEKVSEDFLNTMGITSKTENEEDETKEEKEPVEYIENNAFGISAGTTNEDTKEQDEEDEKKAQEGDDELYESSSSSEVLDIVAKSPTEARPYTPSRTSSEEFSNSKVRNNKNKKNSSRSKKNVSSSFSPAMSSRVSSASLNSLGYFPYQDQETFIYKQVPFAPPAPHRSFSNLSRGSSRTNLSSYGGGQSIHPHQQQQPQFYSNGFTTSGSQVMAQYLAQSQHANMVYAANVLNTSDDYGYEDDNAGYYHPGYNSNNNSNKGRRNNGNGNSTRLRR